MNGTLLLLAVVNTTLMLSFFYRMRREQERAESWEKAARDAVEAMRRMSDRL